MSRIFDISTVDDKIRPAGWYQSKNSADASLIVSNSTHNVSGVIRFDNETSIFQGFNGVEWVTFNSTKGDKGDKGTDFNALVKLENTGAGDGHILLNNICSANDDPSVKARSLISGFAILNNKSIKTIDITTNENTIELKSAPLPAIWDISQHTINNIINKADNSLCAYGDISICTVAPGCKITRGQAVKLTLGQTSFLTIEPLVYQMPVNSFKKNIAFYGIALEDSTAATVRVCTKGITAVKITANIPKEYIANTGLTECGLPGLVAPDGFLFNSPVKPMCEYIQAGVFLQAGDITKSEFVLFKL
jgi:hypothetical protein